MKIYRGTRGSSGCSVDVLSSWGASMLRHHMRHSPDGFEWGYSGSGPSELARCLLIDVLGQSAICQRCMGQGAIRWHGPGLKDCPDGCDEGLLIDRPMYQAFREDVVARLPQQVWALAEDEIWRWAADYLARKEAER